MLPVSSETGNSVSIATGYGLDGPGIESWWGRHFPHRSRPAPGTQPATCTMGTGSFPEVKRGRGVKLTPHPLLVTWSWKGRAIPLLPLWAVRPVQSLSACTGVHFTFTFTSVPVQGCTLPLPLPQCLYKGTLYLYLYLSTCTSVHFTFTFTSVPVKGCTLLLPLPQCLYKGALYLYHWNISKKIVLHPKIIVFWQMTPCNWIGNLVQLKIPAACQIPNLRKFSTWSCKTYPMRTLILPRIGGIQKGGLWIVSLIYSTPSPPPGHIWKTRASLSWLVLSFYNPSRWGSSYCHS